MADIVSGDIIATTMERYSSKLVANLPKRSPALNYIAKSGRSTDGGFSGRVYRQPLEYGFNTNVQFYTGAEKFAVQRTSAFTHADFNMRQLVGTVVIEGLEEAMNDGAEAAINFVEAKIKNLEKSLQMINAESFHFDGTEHDGKGFSGIKMFVPDDPTSGSVGGVSASEDDQRGRNWWQSQIIKVDELPAVHEAGLQVRPYTRSLNRLKIKCSDGPDMPDMLLSGDDHYVQILEEIQEKVLLTDTKRGGIGFTNIVYMPIGDAPIIHDTIQDEDRTHMLNTEYLYCRKAKGRWMKKLTPARPIDQDISAKSIIGYGNLTIANRERQGVLLDT